MTGSLSFMHFFYSLGIGGKGVIPSRHNDRYGFGFYYIDVKNPNLQGLFQNTKLLRDEYGFEAFYNIAVTPWLLLSPDIQVVRGAQKNTFTIDSLPTIVSRKSVGTATILGCA
jgi:porin